MMVKSKGISSKVSETFRVRNEGNLPRKNPLKKKSDIFEKKEVQGSGLTT